MEPQTTQNYQSNPEEKEQSWKKKKKKEQSWRHNPPRLQPTLQSYCNQNSMVLAQNQTRLNGKE